MINLSSVKTPALLIRRLSGSGLAATACANLQSKVKIVQELNESKIVQELKESKWKDLIEKRSGETCGQTQG